MTNNAYLILVWNTQIFLLEQKRRKLNVITPALQHIQDLINREHSKISCNV